MQFPWKDRHEIRIENCRSTEGEADSPDFSRMHIPLNEA
jgi:hypothetical protein